MRRSRNHLEIPDLVKWLKQLEDAVYELERRHRPDGEPGVTYQTDPFAGD